MKDRLTAEIEAASKRHSIQETFRELELSRSYPEGKSAYFKRRIFELKQEMTKYRISDNWISNGCIDIMHKDGYWFEEVVKVNLKDRPEAEVWQEVQRFLKVYFLMLNFENFIKEDKEGDPAAWAYCYCILAEVDRKMDLNFAPESKTKAIKKLAEANHFNAKGFEIAFNRLRKSKQAGKTSLRQIPTIKKAIELLKDNPAGLAIAAKYLRIAEAQL